ncbi:MAG: efflux RND transporter permease subunit [Paraclostridium sp.]
MIPKFSVKRPYTVAVAVVMVLILGVVSFMNMTTDLLPSMDLPYVVVNTPYPGANPEKVETSVTRPLEQALSTTSGLKNISSTSSENVSSIMLEFNQGVNMDSAMIDISGKIDMVKGNLEDEVSSPIIMKLNPDMMPIMMLSIDIEDMGIKEVTEYVENTILPSFERIEGVGSVSAQGLIEDQLKVTLDEDKINDINKKIMDNLDSEFYEQEKGLSNAESEITKSKQALESQMGTEKKKLEDAKVEITKAKNQLQGVVDSIGMTKEELQKSIDDANKELIKIELQIDNLKLSIDKLPEEQATAILEQINQLDAVAKQIQDGIDKAKGGIEAIDSLAQLKKQEGEISTGIATMDKELKSAQSELSAGQQELKDAKKQLKTAKEGAYKSADITEKITPEMIGNILMAENFSMPAGYVKEGETEYSVKVGEKFTNKEEIENLLLFDIDIDSVGEIRVEDVATVEFTDNSSETYTNINGNEGVILTFQKSSSYSTTEVTKSINEEIKEISQSDENIHITTLMDQGVYIDMIVDSVLSNLVYGGILAILVLLIFLKSFKTTIVVAFSIPISLLFALVLMYFSGVTLNIISLSGLALGVGMLVDNSIVVIENIYRLKNEGMSSAKAAIYGTKQVATAISASTLTTICVFLPIVFTEGMTKQLFVDMGLTIAYSLVASLLVALTVVPAMASNLINNVEDKQHKWFDKFVNVYEVLLKKSLKHKWVVLLFAIGLLGFSGYSALRMGTSFMPAMDSTQMSVTMTMPKESKRSETIERSNEFIDKVLTIEDVETIGALEGSQMGPMASGDMSFYIILKEDKKHSNIEVEEMIYDKTKDMNCEIDVMASNMDMSALGGSGIAIQIKGSELDKLQEISKDIMKVIESVKGTKDITNGLEEADSEVRIVVDKNKAMEYGLTVAQVYQIIAKELETEKISTNVSIENKEYPVIIAKDNDISRDTILEQKIKANKGNEEVEIKLSEIAKAEEAKSLNSINRDNQSRYMTVNAGLESGYNIGLVSREVEDKLKDFEVPTGYSIEMQGENETITKSLRDMVLMGAMAITFVYLIMVAQFGSLLSPFIVMFTIPLAFTGGLLALLITGQEISVTSMLGFLVLSGVVVNNGIVFVDYINQLRQEGRSKKDAILKTGRDRIRPVLMTASTTILAMSTMAMGVGMGAEMSQGLAIVTIGGLLYSTILTLFIIPILYDLLHKREIKPIIIDED